MSKSKFFTGQPIFSQLLSLIPRHVVATAAREFNTDRYRKSYSTYDHLVTLLFGIYNNCTSIREITTGMLAWEDKINHLGINSYSRKSTFADANSKINPAVFERIYLQLLDLYQQFLPDSRPDPRDAKTYLADATVITLFTEVMEGTGRTNNQGKRKGGIKMQALIRRDQDVPCLIQFSEAKSNDVAFLKEIKVPKGSVLVFDKGYLHYQTFNRFTEEGVTWVTRIKSNAVYAKIERRPVHDKHTAQGVIADTEILIGNNTHKDATKTRARLVEFKDPETGKAFEFITNNFRLSPVTVSGYYKKRWQIELLFKRLKQNYQLQYFYGETQNAIKNQIWCMLIADLLLKIVKSQTKTKYSFSNLACIARLNLMSYINLKMILTSTETQLLQSLKQRKSTSSLPDLFKT
jgi:hypothetical protein